MNHPSTRSLYEYWNELRAGRDAPCRSEIDPRRISGSLGTMFILERLDDGQLRFRLAGTRLCEMLGMEARGLLAESIMAEGHGRQIHGLGSEALREPGVGVMRVEAFDGAGVDWAGEVILLPLRSELGEMTRLMGAVNLSTPLRGRRPAPPLRLRWIGSRMAPVETGPFAPAEGPLPHAPGAPESPVAQGFSDPAEAFGRGDRVEARPSLTAIDGDLDAPRTSEKDKRPRPRLRLVD